MRVKKMTLAFSDSIVETTADFEHSVAQISDSSIRDARGVVLRVHATLWRRIVQGNCDSGTLTEHLEAVARRAPGLDVYLLPDGHSLAEHWLANGSVQVPLQVFDGQTLSIVQRHVSGDVLDAIRETELTNTFANGRARSVICASANHHFALPSGAHATQFIRLGDSFADIETVDRVAYWTAIEIQSRSSVLGKSGTHVVIVDHPSMLILAARVQLIVGIAVEVMAFPTYPSDIQSRTASFELLRDAATRYASVFVVISVASTGRLASFIQQWAATEYPESVNVLVLYALYKIEGASILCRLSLNDYQHFANAAECTLCRTNSVAVQIHTSSYLVGYSPSEAVALPPKFFKLQKPFLAKWGSHAGVLRVHYDDPNEASARHHAFYIDVGTLLELAEFRDEVRSKSAQFEPAPDVIVVPDHRTARKIGALLSEMLGRPLVVLDAQLFARGQGPIDADLHAATCALVVDDLFITGSRLDSINRLFRERRSERVPNLKTIHFWTVLATPASQTEYSRVVAGITGNHTWKSTVTHLYDVPLPDWHDPRDCPWCMEQNVLSGLTQTLGLFDGPMVDRLSSLSASFAGVSADPFYVAQPGVQIPALGAESAVLHQDANAMQVLFACASAIQQLRVASDKSLNSEQFPAPAFFAERVFSTNYTERLIWLGMLRSLKGKELEPKLRSYLSTVALDLHDLQHELVSGEFAIAWLVGKLGAIPVSQVCKAFFASTGIPWEALYAQALVDTCLE
jgi:hypothetical protein